MLVTFDSLAFSRYTVGEAPKDTEDDEADEILSIGSTLQAIAWNMVKVATQSRVSMMYLIKALEEWVPKQGRRPPTRHPTIPSIQK